MLVLRAVPFLVVLALAPSAQAATRYASPAGVTTAQLGCTATVPCALQTAVNAAQNGDDVLVAPGDYLVTSTIHPRSGVLIHGDSGQPRPRLHGTGQLNGDVLQLQQASASHLAVESAGRSSAAVTLRDGTGSDLILAANGSDAAVLMQSDQDGTNLVGSVATCNGCSSGAIVMKEAQAQGLDTAVNVTAIANGAAPAILASGTTTTLALVNVIAAGSASDIDASGSRLPLQATFSSFRAAASSNVADGGGNVGAPLLADAAGHEALGSPTLDAGTMDPRAGATDPDGNPRTVGPATDIGAYETTTLAFATGATPGGDGSGNGNGNAFGKGLGNGLSQSAAAALLGDSPADLAPVGTPKAGRSVAVGTAAGTVLVRSSANGTFVPLADASQLPLGAEIDARQGAVRLTSAADSSGTPQTGIFTGSRFKVTLTKGAKPLTVLQLTGGSFATCGAQARAAPATDAVAAGALAVAAATVLLSLFLRWYRVESTSVPVTLSADPQASGWALLSVTDLVAGAAALAGLALALVVHRAIDPALHAVVGRADVVPALGPYLAMAALGSMVLAVALCALWRT